MAKKTKKATGSKTKPNAIPIDFTNTGGGGGGNPRLPEGDYKVKFVDWKIVSKRDDPDRKAIQVFMKILEPEKRKGKQISDRLWLKDSQGGDSTLFRIRLFLEAMGVQVPEKVARVNFNKYIGNELAVTLVDNEYNGRTTSQVGDYIDLDTYAGADDEDEEDEEDEDEEEEDEDEDEEDEELEEMDVDDDL